MNFIKKLLKQIIKYRFLEIGFWLYQYFSLSHLITRYNYPNNGYQFAFVVILFQILAVYFNVIFNLKHFFYKGKYVIFFLLFISSCCFFVLLTDFSNDILRIFIFGKGEIKFSYISSFGHFHDLMLVSVSFLIVYLIIHFFNKDRENQKLREKQLEDELNYLKAQINPHFLFNILNSIYFLVEDQKDKAKDLILLFSKSLRYQLYNESSKLVDINKELTFLKDYVEIEKLGKEDELIVAVDFPSEIYDLNIYPMILVTFVENAFKHVSHFSDQRNKISISAKLDGTFLRFTVENTFEIIEAKGTMNNGIGLINSKRRLELLYSNAHELTIKKNNGFHIVELSIDLDENKLFNS